MCHANAPVVNVCTHQNIIKQEEISLLWAFTANLCHHSIPNETPPGDEQVLRVRQHESEAQGAISIGSEWGYTPMYTKYDIRMHATQVGPFWLAYS